ncbi:MAG: AMP-binding protein [Dehalococcoidales bacterium]|nr:AMP-binding protein [Dehalococcoidales bacterium]
MALKAVRKDVHFDDIETRPINSRRLYQEGKLHHIVKNAYKRAPSVREMMDKAKAKPSNISTIKSLEKLPITRKTDLIELQKSKPPYGGFLTVKPQKIERIFISPGPIYEPLHSSKIKWFAQSFWAAGFRKGDIVLNTFTYHLSPAGTLFHEALRHCGATVVVTGTGNTEIQIQTMRDLKVNGFVGTPSFLMTLIKKAEEMGLNFRNDFALERAWFTGEMLSPSVRKTLEEDYGIDTRQAYAVTEPGGAIAYECARKSGLHLMDDYIVEIVDPVTGKQLKPGEVGEIVVTPIHNKAWGLIRFGTGDLSSLITEKCLCGRTSYRLSGILGRTGDAVKVRGMFVVARQADEVIMSSDTVSRYQLAVNRTDQRDELTLKAELKDETTDRTKLANDLNEKFQSVCRVKIDKIEFLKPGTLPEKYQKISDERKWD